jgi:hypothetical protein
MVVVRERRAGLKDRKPSNPADLTLSIPLLGVRPAVHLQDGEMRQIRVSKTQTKTSRQRRASLLDTLPLDPRDPDILRAKRPRRATEADSASVPR